MKFKGRVTDVKNPQQIINQNYRKRSECQELRMHKFDTALLIVV